MNQVYYIGGSPCSGKSTVAEALAQTYKMHYFKVDDYLDGYTAKAAASGKPICKKIMNMTPEQIWMRDPKIQSVEELQFYEEIFEFIRDDIHNITSQNGIITEGAAYLPLLMKSCMVSKNHYINITPSPDFQISHFRKRWFVPEVLKGCRDQEKAFMNWMNRDILFSNEVREQCMDLGYKAILNDGTMSIDELIHVVSRHFDFI